MKSGEIKPIGHKPNLDINDPSGDQLANTADPSFELLTDPGEFKTESKRVHTSLPHLEVGTNSRRRA